MTQDDFINYPIISSKVIDGSFEGDAVRGDGYCSIWATLIGWSLVNRDLLIRNFMNFTQPKNIKELIEIIVKTGNIIIGLMGSKNKFEYESFQNDSAFTKLEIETMINQLELDNIDTIIGRSHFQIMALLFDIQICIFDEEDQRIHKIGNSNYPTVRISTNGIHYHVHNNKVGEDLDHFINKFWWYEQWKNHPHIKNNEDIEPCFI